VQVETEQAKEMERADLDHGAEGIREGVRSVSASTRSVKRWRGVLTHGCGGGEHDRSTQKDTDKEDEEEDEEDEEDEEERIRVSILDRLQPVIIYTEERRKHDDLL
jgi:TATA-binding protein-associated factor Taf7